MPDAQGNKTPAEVGSPEFAEDRTQVNSLNNKWLFDTSALEDSQGRRVRALADNSWETLRYRIANDAATASHLANMNAIISGQVGDTSGQQTVSPIRTGAGDYLAAGAVPSNRITDTSGAVAGAGVNATIATSLAGLLAPILATAVGNAITAAFAQNFPTPAQNATTPPASAS